jgi:hypothetical protein
MAVSPLLLAAPHPRRRPQHSWYSAFVALWPGSQSLWSADIRTSWRRLCRAISTDSRSPRCWNSRNFRWNSRALVRAMRSSGNDHIVFGSAGCRSLTCVPSMPVANLVALLGYGRNHLWLVSDRFSRPEALHVQFDCEEHNSVIAFAQGLPGPALRPSTRAVRSSNLKPDSLSSSGLYRSHARRTIQFPLDLLFLIVARHLSSRANAEFW